MNRLQSRVRVVVVAQAAPARGGIPSFVANLLADAGLAKQVEFTLVNTTRRAERTGGRLTVGNARTAIEDTVRVFRAAGGADVVHVQSALLPVGPLVRAVALCAAANLRGAGVVCHVHSGRLNSGQTEAFSLSGVDRFWLRMLDRFTDRVVTVAAAGADALRPHVPRTPVTTIHNAVDVASFSTTDPGAGDVRLVYVGTLSRRKGLADLVAALELLYDEGLELPLDVVGGSHEVGPEEAAEVTSACAGSRAPIRLLGSLSPAEVREVLRTASAFVLPSHWEGQPIAIVEAMATGVPVVVTTVGANPDVVRDGVDGFLVAPHDVGSLARALRAVAADPERRRAMGAAARVRALEVLDLPVLRENLLVEYAGARRHARPRRRPSIPGRPGEVV